MLIENLTPENAFHELFYTTSHNIGLREIFTSSESFTAFILLWSN